MKSLLRKLLAVTLTVVESARFEDGCLVVSVRPRRTRMSRCPACGRRRPVYDGGARVRRWRSLDLGSTRTYLEYAVRRVECPEHGVRVESVPWAHPASRFTRAFEEQVAWLCMHANRSVVAEMMRVDWKSVGGICGRVFARLDAEAGSRFDGLERIGIDETSYKKGHKYMTVVIDHGTGRVVWCAKGHGKEVLDSFFDLLTDGQRASITAVSADGAGWIADVVARRCPNAERVMDPFHVVSWMTDVLDEVRRQAWRRARNEDKAAKAAGRAAGDTAGAVKRGRFALLKNPEDLTQRQALDLGRIAREDKRLYRAYLLKERLRDVFRAPDAGAAASLLDSWLRSASHSWTKEIRELSRKVRRQRDAIVRAVGLGMSNARVEAVNNKIKLTIRMGYGFRNIDNLIALVMLRCSNLPIELPCREQAT